MDNNKNTNVNTNSSSGDVITESAQINHNNYTVQSSGTKQYDFDRMKGKPKPQQQSSGENK